MKRDERDILKTIDKTMSKVICRIDYPFVACPVVRAFENTVCRQVPHLGIWIAQVLFHAQCSIFWTVLSILHVFKLC